MKRIITLGKLAITGCIILLSISASAHEHDTLKCHFADTSSYTLTLYPAGNGGYICGVNGSGDKEIAQKFGQAPAGDTLGTECSVGDEHQLNEILVYFGAKKVGNPNDSIYIKVYSADPVSGAPDSLLGISFPVQMNYVDTSSTSATYTDFLMQLPIVFTDSFFLSVVYSGGTGDTVGIMSSTNGQALNSQLCWIKNSSGNWMSLLMAHSLDADAVIFPVVGDATIGINEVTPVISGVKVFPNPSPGNSTIEYTATTSIRNMIFTLYDISGKVIYTIPLNNIQSGKNRLTLNTSVFISGTYFYSFESRGKKFSGRIQILQKQ